MERNEGKSSCQLSVKESLTYGYETLRESYDKFQEVIHQLQHKHIVGPLVPAMQHLEEGSFWIRKCIDVQDAELLKMEIDEKDKRDNRQS